MMTALASLGTPSGAGKTSGCRIAGDAGIDDPRRDAARLERGLELRRERLVLRQTEAGSQAVAERHDDRRLTLRAPMIERGEDEAQRNGSGN